MFCLVLHSSARITVSFISWYFAFHVPELFSNLARFRSFCQQSPYCYLISICTCQGWRASLGHYLPLLQSSNEFLGFFAWPVQWISLRVEKFCEHFFLILKKLSVWPMNSSCCDTRHVLHKNVVQCEINCQISSIGLQLIFFSNSFLKLKIDFSTIFRLLLVVRPSF